MLKKLKQKLDWAIYLQVNESTMRQRALNRGLVDDRLDMIERRLKNFAEFTVPILEYYQYQKRLLIINGEQSPEQVTQEIIAQLKF